MWQPQPQKNRPKIAVRTVARRKNTRPAFTMECLENSMASEGSRGVIVSPFEYQWAMWAAIAVGALVSLLGAFAPQLLTLMGGTAEVGREGRPFTAIMLGGNITVMLLFLIAGFYHMKLGMQVGIEDYISHEGAKIALLLCVTLGTVALATASVFALLKLALGS